MNSRFFRGWQCIGAAVALAASPLTTHAARELSPRQQIAMDRYLAQLKATSTLEPAGFAAHFSTTFEFLKTFDPHGEERIDDLLFTVLVAELTPNRLVQRHGREAGEAWHDFVQREIDRGLATSPDEREREILSVFDAALAGETARAERTNAEKLALFGEKLDVLEARFPQTPTRVPLEQRYLELAEKSAPTAAFTRSERLARGANADVARIAQARLEVAKLQREPLQMKFTAADGREVDLTQLRGKVVLIDFWATWCGPCVAELPNVKAVHASYRERGFEVIGIAFEDAGIVTEAELPRVRQRHPSARVDTTEEAEAKRAAARAKLLAFVAARGLPWPQHCDGNYWQNEFGVAFGIRSLPATFLLDRDGRLVARDLRGEKLEREVRRLLGP